jgi:hypothetical protein
VAFLLVSDILSNTLFVLTLIPPNSGIETHRESSSAIYSLMMRQRCGGNTTYTDLSTALRLNDPSEAKHKRQNDTYGSADPVIEHLMSSKAFKAVVWSLILAVLALGAAITAVGAWRGTQWRATYLVYMGGPAILGSVLLSTAIAMMCSRRLR